MIKPLTSLRFVFALMVFFSHLNFLYSQNNVTFRWLYDRIFYEGYIGVGFFFMLSGFILALNYKERLLEKKISLRDFWLLRLIRIYPLHLLTLYLCIPYSYLHVEGNTLLLLKPFLSSFFLLQSFVPSLPYYFAFNAPSWSISDELFFYILFPFLIFLLHKKNVPLLVAALSLLVVPLLMKYQQFTLRPHYWFYIHPLLRIVDFILGILLFDLFQAFLKRRKQMNFDVIEIAAVSIFLIFFYFHNDIPFIYRYSCYYWLPIGFVLFAFAFQKGIMSQFLSSTIFVYLGEISFGFYLWHFMVLKYYIQLKNSFSIAPPTWLSILLLFLVTLLLSIVSFRYFETPVSRYLKSKLFIKK